MGENREKLGLDEIQLMAISGRLDLVWFRLFRFGLVWLDMVRIGLVRLG